VRRLRYGLPSPILTYRKMIVKAGR
jgi:hypothetical protein